MRRLTNKAREEKYGSPLKKTTLDLVEGIELTTDAGGERVKYLAHASLKFKVNQAIMIASREMHEWPDDIQGFNVRRVRGGKTWSLHSWALAWDIFAKDGPVVDPITGHRTMSSEWFRIAAEELGGVWGGTFSKPDVHHLEYPY